MSNPPKITCCLTDVHGMYLTMMALLKKVDDHLDGAPHEIILLGDGIDRGPRSREVVEWAMANKIRTVAGNHEDLSLAYSEHAKLGYKAKCLQYYERNVWLHNGGKDALASWGPKTKALPRDVLDWMATLPPYLIIDTLSQGRKLLASHTGYALDADKGNWMRALWGRRDYDSWDWTHDERGNPVDDGLFRAYGHTRVDSVVVKEDHVNLDSGAAYGGSLTAFIWPERTLISQPGID